MLNIFNGKIKRFLYLNFHFIIVETKNRDIFSLSLFFQLLKWCKFNNKRKNE